MHEFYILHQHHRASEMSHGHNDSTAGCRSTPMLRVQREGTHMMAEGCCESLAEGEEGKEAATNIAA